MAWKKRHREAVADAERRRRAELTDIRRRVDGPKFKPYVTSGVRAAEDLEALGEQDSLTIMKWNWRPHWRPPEVLVDEVVKGHLLHADRLLVAGLLDQGVDIFCKDSMSALPFYVSDQALAEARREMRQRRAGLGHLAELGDSSRS